MKIAKTVLIITILHPVWDAPAAFGLSDIAREIDGGEWLGQVSAELSQDVIPEDKVTHECLALGNDGEFFNLG